MQTTWKPTVAGVLAIAAGALNMLMAIVMSIFMPVAAPFYTAFTTIGILLLLFVATGVVAIIGGIQALKRRRWGLALAGAICAMLPPSTLLGIVSTVFVTLARDEFESSARVGTTHYLDAEIVSDTSRQCQTGAGHLQQPSEGERNA